MPKRKRKPKSKKTIPLNVKALGNDISAYPFVEIEWLDIEVMPAGQILNHLTKKNYQRVYQKVILLVKNGVTRIFTDYIKSKDKPTFDSIGNTTIIPTAVIESIKT